MKGTNFGSKPTKASCYHALGWNLSSHPTYVFREQKQRWNKVTTTKGRRQNERLCSKVSPENCSPGNVRNVVMSHRVLVTAQIEKISGSLRLPTYLSERLEQKRLSVRTTRLQVSSRNSGPMIGLVGIKRMDLVFQSVGRGCGCGAAKSLWLRWPRSQSSQRAAAPRQHQRERLFLKCNSQWQVPGTERPSGQPRKCTPPGF